MKTSNLVLLALGLFALGFIVAMTVIFCVKGAVPDTLIQYTLGAGGGEALLLAGIKVSKILGPPREPSEAGRVGRDGGNGAERVPDKMERSRAKWSGISGCDVSDSDTEI